MEASGVGGNGAAQGDAAQQGQQGDGQQQGGQDFGALAQQLESLGPQLEAQRQSLQGVTDWIQQQQGAGDDGQQQADEPVLDLSQLGPEFAYMDEGSQQQFQQGFQQAVSQAVAQAMEPVTRQQQEFRMEQQARDLVSEFPELGERETAEQVVGLAGDIADQNFPPEVANVLKNSPGFWRLVFLSGRGVETANNEGAGESAQAATLEGGGGAAPAGGNQRQGPYFQNPNDQGSGRLPF